MQVYVIPGLPVNNKISHCVPAIKGSIGFHGDWTEAVNNVFAVHRK